MMVTVVTFLATWYLSGIEGLKPVIEPFPPISWICSPGVDVNNYNVICLILDIYSIHTKNWNSILKDKSFFKSECISSIIDNEGNEG